MSATLQPFCWKLQLFYWNHPLGLQLSSSSVGIFSSSVGIIHLCLQLSSSSVGIFSSSVGIIHLCLQLSSSSVGSFSSSVGIIHLYLQLSSFSLKLYFSPLIFLKLWLQPSRRIIFVAGRLDHSSFCSKLSRRAKLSAVSSASQRPVAAYGRIFLKIISLIYYD